MKKLIRKVDFIFSIVCAVIFTFIIVGCVNQPEEFVFYDGVEKIRYLDVYSVEKTDNAVRVSFCSSAKETEAEMNFLGIIPVSQVNAVVSDRKYVAVGGDLIGIKIYTEGLLVVGTEDVITKNGNVNPAENCGIRTGDIITHVNDEIVTSVNSFSEIMSCNEGENIGLTVKRDDDIYYYSLCPAFCETENRYRCGLWLKDSTAGIGTMTFTDPETGMFASLGHSICDSETKTELSVGDGDIFTAAVKGCDKGQKGETGQIKGTFMSDDIGDIIDNNEFGLYGTCSAVSSDEYMYPLASQGEVKTGAAKIISTVSGDTKQFYDIEIEKINNSNSHESRSLVIKITDPELLSLTGGIVQGMSGSPIIQDGKLVGAVTHVFLNDPTKGYGIYAETMFETMNNLSE